MKKGDRSLPKFNYFCVAMYYKQLNSEQRYALSLFLKEKISYTAIAKKIGVSISTISREVKRNRSKRGYSYKKAQESAEIRKERSTSNRSICKYIKQKALEYLTKEQWSPQQISGYLLKTEGIQISHETIYKMIRADKAAGGKLYLNCRNKGKYRKRAVGKVTPIPNRKSIHERPIEADGTRIGDIEMDLIVGKGNKGAILTLADRATNFLWMHKLEQGKNAEGVAKAVCQELFPYIKYIKTITTDNGSEFAKHEAISKGLKGISVYFADPYSSWQKGCIENANKLIRQYIPKNMDFSLISQDFVKSIQYKINARPRKKLNFDSPKKVFFNFIS